MLLDQLRGKGPVPVTRGAQLKITIQRFDGLSAFSITAVGGDFLAEMRIQFSLQGLLQ